MNRFFSSLKMNIVTLPANLRSGLFPGSGTDPDNPSRKMRRSFVFHLHPVQVTHRALKVTTTFGLGLITATLSLVLAVTGVLLMIYYVPTPERALLSTTDIQHAVIFGGFVRALHRWAAHGMVLFAGLHLLRVFLTGAYAGRALNWLFGLALFGLTLGLAFTGYLLPWDQLSYWAVTVSANLMDHVPLAGGALKDLLLGGTTVGAAALVRFYTLHVALLPGLLLLVVVLHLWRVRKDGGLARPATDTEEMVSAWPHLLLREAVLILVVLTVLTIVAATVDAPLGGAPDIHHPSNPEKTPWYFLFLQEMVSYSATVGGFVFPAVLTLGLFLLPFVDRDEQAPGTWLGTRRERTGFAISLIMALVAFAVSEVLFQQSGTAEWLAAASPMIRDLFNPSAFMLLLAAATFFVAGAISGTTRGAYLSALAVILVAMAGFTVVGFCRGPGWVFFWPWEVWPDV